MYIISGTKGLRVLRHPLKKTQAPVDPPFGHPDSLEHKTLPSQNHRSCIRNLAQGLTNKKDDEKVSIGGIVLTNKIGVCVILCVSS